MGQATTLRKKQARWGLKGKLILSMLTVGVFPLLIGLVMAFLGAKEQLREVSGGSFAGLATETARKLDLVISDEMNRTARIASDPLVVEALENRRDQAPTSGLPQSQIESAAQAWDANHPDAVAAITKSGLADLLRRYYSETDAQTGGGSSTVRRSATRALFVTDTTGALVASINGAVPYQNSHTSWWRGAFHKGVGKPYIESVAFDEGLNTYTFTLSLPIMDSIQYHAVGVLHRAYDASEFLAPSIHPIRFGKTGHVMLIDSKGTVISCPVLSTGIRLADPELISLVTPIESGWVNAPSDGHGGQRASIVGFASLPATSRITHDSTGLRWHTFVWQSSEELFAPIQHLLTWISVFGIVAVGLLVTLGYVAAGRIVTPIRRLQEAAQLIGRGEFREPLAIKTGDEIEDLADEINRMNSQLEVAFAGLTDQVTLKTQEVQYLQKSTDQILDSVATPITLLDHEGHIQYMNRASKEAFDLHQPDLEGARLFDLIPTDEPSREKLRQEFVALDSQLDDSEDSDSEAEQAVRFKVQDPLVPQQAQSTDVQRDELHIGSRIYRYEWFRVSGRLGEAQRIGLIFRDTTDESRLQDQLIQAEKSGSLGVLSAGIGHELNNPLFSVLGLGEAIQEESDLTKAKSLAKDIVQYGKRMAAIVRDFTGLAHADPKERSVWVDVNDQLDQAVKAVQSGYPTSALEVRTELRPLPKLYAMPDELRQAFLNVIRNCCEAMQGQGILSLRTEAHENHMKIVIGDSGPGIPKPFLKRIFDPFFTTKGQGKGTGLGLTVAQRIVTKYGGHIHVDSEEGQGTVCHITLPVRVAAELQKESR
ncbi:MAG: ATP-binding protein [Nitrospiraceae bacterium]